MKYLLFYVFVFAPSLLAAPALAEAQRLAAAVQNGSPGAVAEIRKILAESYQSSQKKSDPALLYVWPEEKAWDVDSQRRHMQELVQTVQAKNFAGEAPGMFLLHYSLAQALARSDEPFAAAFHFRQALRYRSLRLTSDVYTSAGRLEQTPPEEAASAEEYGQLLAQIKSEQQTVDLLKKRLLAIEEISTAPGQTEQAALLREQAEKKKLLQEAETRLLESQGRLPPLQKRFEDAALFYHRLSARFLSELADNLQTLDQQITDTEKFREQKTYYTNVYSPVIGPVILQNATRSGELLFLEMALRLDPTRSDLAQKLVKKYRQAGKVDDAIMAAEKLLSALVNNPDASQKPKPADLAGLYHLLSALYHEKKNHVEAAYYLGETIALVDQGASPLASSELPDNLLFQQAQMDIRYTGNFARAEKTLIKIISAEAPRLQVASGTRQEIGSLKKQIQLLAMLALAMNKQQKAEGMQVACNEVLRLHQQLLDHYSRSNDQRLQLQAGLVEAKRQLVRVKTRENVDLVLGLQQQLLDQDSQMQEIEAALNSLDLQRPYFLLAFFHEERHNYTTALEIFTLAEKRGVDAASARKYADRLRARW